MMAMVFSFAILFPDGEPSGGTGREGDETAIRELLERFVSAFNAGDADEAARVYTDPHVDVNAKEPVSSRTQTAAWFRSIFRKFELVLEVTSDEIVVSGDWALQRGEFRQTLTPKGETRALTEPRTITRRYIEVLKRQPDGSWLVFWSMDGERAVAP